MKNSSQLLGENLDDIQLNLRKIGLISLEKAINAVKPRNLIEKSFKIQNNQLIINNDEYNLNDFKKIFIIGGGKATAEMAISLEDIIKKYSNMDYEGIINIPEGLKGDKSENLSKIQINYTSHPIPDENGLIGTKSMVELVLQSSKNDLIICLISGGGSALLPLPKNGLTLKDLQRVNSLLLASGASIHEINAIRKHLSDFKGGNLAKKVYASSGATLISLIISDVVGDDLDTIASGPTVPDSTTFKDCIKVLKKYNLLKRIPTSIKNVLVRGINKEIPENPKINDPSFKRVNNYIIGSVKVAVEMVSDYLKEQLFHVEYFFNEMEGEASGYGRNLYHLLNQKLEKNLIHNRMALIGTGELTVTLMGNGIGGRNQEMLLSFLDYIKNKDINYDFLIIAANLDGIEGNSEAMGALVDNKILAKMVENNLNPQRFLKKNDSNSFFKMCNYEILTGPTGCNVNDIIMCFIISK